MPFDPLHLDPLLVPKPWGGRRLARLGRRLPAGEQIGESWDVADLGPGVTSVEDPCSRVAVGPCAGRSLADLIAADATALLGGVATPDGRFPLLVKTLDAREHLSVQVHPPQAYVDEHPEVHLKTESWVVVDADPGAYLMLGFRDGVTLDDVRGALGTPAIAELLRRVPARAGDVHHLPAGLAHALGAGVMVAEVQTPSDTTFRLYDWTEEYGRAPRELHLEAGMAAIELGWGHNLAGPDATRWQGDHPTTIVDTAYYRIDRRRLSTGEARRYAGGVPCVLLVVDGRVAGDDLAYPLDAGGVVLLPASWTGTLTATATATVLEVFAA